MYCHFFVSMNFVHKGDFEMKTTKASKTNTRSRIIFFATLTPKEREIFDYYLAGKKAKEIFVLNFHP